jgi:hypothetical protein
VIVINEENPAGSAHVMICASSSVASR